MPFLLKNYIFLSIIFVRFLSEIFFVSILLKSITFSNEKKQNNVLVFPTSIVNFIK